jgi:hypothetical protein
MPDVRTIVPKTYTFVDNWDGTARHVYGLEDGSCLNVVVTATMAALQIAGESKFIARYVQPPESK